MRNNFAKHLRQTSEKKSGDGASPPTKEYYLAKQLSFLRPYIRRRCQLGMVAGSKVEEDDADKRSDDAGEDLPEEEDEEPKTRQGQKRQSDTVDDCIMSYFKKRATEVDQEQDADLQFLKSLLPYMKKLNDDDKLDFRCEVMQTLNRFIRKERVHGGRHFATAFRNEIPVMPGASAYNKSQPAADYCNNSLINM